MTEHKFTDEEIIRALEHCESSCSSEACVGCPFDEKGVCTEAENALAIFALDLINRQREEIERLRKYTEEPSPAPNNTCICCGEIIPEGRQVCPSCEKQLKNYKLKGVKTKTIGKYVAPDLGVQLTIDDMENNNEQKEN